MFQGSDSFMKVCIVASFAPSLRLFRGPMIEAMVAAGHRVEAVAPDLSRDAPLVAWLTARGVVCHDVPMARLGLNPIADLRCLLALWRLMRRMRPDVFLGYTIKPVIWGLIAARLAGVPRRAAMISGLGFAFQPDGPGLHGKVRRLARGLYRLALRQATLVFLQNPDDRDDLQRLGILPPDRPVVVLDGSGIDVDAYPQTAIPAAPVRFLIIARMIAAKGLREFVAAAERVRHQWPEAAFRIVGGQEDNPDAVPRAELDRWRSDGVVDWVGPLQDVRPEIAACHVYVLPSYREGTPRSVLEAMSMGRAVITTDAPGCRETVVPGDNGLLVPVAEVEPLVRAMLHFRDHPEEIARMGARGRVLAESRYDVRKVNAVILSNLSL